MSKTSLLLVQNDLRILFFKLKKKNQVQHSKPLQFDILTHILFVSKNESVSQSAHYLEKFAEYIIYQFYKIMLVHVPSILSDYRYIGI